MTSEKRVQDASLHRSGKCFWFIGRACVKFDSLNQSEVIPDRRHNTLQVWFNDNDRENAQIEIRYENEKILGSLRNDDGDEERQKSNRFRQAKQQLCTFITLFCTFLCRRCTNTTLTWNGQSSRFVDDGNKRPQLSTFFFWTLIQFFRIQLQKTLPTFE